MKKISAIILALFLVFSFATIKISAGSIESIAIEVRLHEDGSATIRDTRTFTTHEGSEHYLSFGNLGNIELLDYHVYDASGNELERKGDWSINLSREEKAGKYGINYTNDGFEICFGYGDYGTHTFTIEYTFSNFVFNLTDGNQGIYWKFLNENMDPINKASVKIYNDIGFLFKYPTTRIWGFGYRGQTEISEDYLYIYTEEPMNASNYMVVLSIFDGQNFTTQNSKDWSSEELINLAMDGAVSNNINNTNETHDYGNKKTVSENESVFRFFPPVLFFIFFITALIRKIAGKNIPKAKKIKEDDVEYYREVPAENFADVASEIGYETKNVVSAYILKWVFEGKLCQRIDQVGLIFKHDSLSLQIHDDKIPFEDSAEEKLWNMVIAASGEDLVLSEKEFVKYIERKPSVYSNFEELIRQHSDQYLKEVGAFITVKKKFLFFKFDGLDYSDYGLKLRNNILGFKKYLKDYSLLHEKEVKEVALWKEYLIWAAFFGIADTVYKQLKIVNPKVDSEYSGFDMYNMILLTNSLSNNVSNAYSAASFSSGGGGSSFSGGGGGSFGGGSGGGSR